MIEADVYEPLGRFDGEFRDAFAKNAEAMFDGLVRESGIDVRENRKTLAELRQLNTSAEKVQSKLDCLQSFRTLLTLAWIAAAGVLFWNFLADSDLFSFPFDSLFDDSGITIIVLLVGVAAAALCFFCLSPSIKSRRSALASLQEKIKTVKTKAWDQMAPLNALFDWDHTARLVEQTVPRIKLDPYFNESRMTELVEDFGWDCFEDPDRSVLCSQSGEINGNPFVVAQTLRKSTGTKTYHGSLRISWRETVSDSEGRPRTVTRSQTLYASVDKPIPVYSEEKFLLFGNDATPELSFSRRPSGLANVGDGFWDRRKKDRAVKKLESFSRNLDDDNNFTMMANKEFEVLFNCTNRSSEVHFRMLFTPLAQQQMILLLKDPKRIGYGDDFLMEKRRKINKVVPKHLANTRIDTDPSQFYDYDYDQIRRKFLDFNNDFFKSVYFSLAPLLAVPLFQQTRTHKSIYGLGPSFPSYWEHESQANYHGEEKFKHAQSVTRNILKAKITDTCSDTQSVAVTAYGYRGEPRTDYVSKFGGDGRFHDVPVHWTEYLPVSRTTTMVASPRKELSLPKYRELRDAGEWQKVFRNWGNVNPNFRRAIVSFVQPPQ